MHIIKSKFHFVGVGGIGMCGLAELLHNMGAQVSGSDLSENANTEHLLRLGIPLFKGHRAENVGDVDVLVYSSAIPSDNPELQKARALKIPLIPRAEALAEIMRLKRGIAIAGTHGKTTTTSIVSSLFLHANLQPTIVLGGRLDAIKSTALLGNGDWLIAEADESDGSFHRLSPEIAIITNIDTDHMDYYRSFDNLQKAFLDFAEKVPFYGLTIVCGDDPQIRKLFSNYHKQIIFYGFKEDNDYHIKGSQQKYELYKGSSKLGNLQIPVPGKHNALNATAALLTGLKAGLDIEVCLEGIMQFKGVDRRFQLKGEHKNIKIYDDYGHHPTEIRATLQAFREKYPEQRLVVLFQPHRYTRTEVCWHDFLSCFQLCDELILTDIYSAGEKAIEGVSSQKLAKEIKHSKVTYISKTDSLAETTLGFLKPNDVFITLGAGDTWKVGEKILGLLKK